MSSSSSCSTGTETRSAASTGSVSRPRSPPPDRSIAIERSALPTVIFTSRRRMNAAHLREQRGKGVQAHRHPTHQPHRAPQRFALVADRRHGVVQILKHAVAQLEQRFAGRRDPDAPADPVKHRLAKLLLEQQDLPADGRLGYVKFFARGGERAAVSDRPDDFQLAQVHAASIHSRCAWVQGNPCGRWIVSLSGALKQGPPGGTGRQEARVRTVAGVVREAFRHHRVIATMPVHLASGALLFDVSQFAARRQLAVAADHAAAGERPKPEEPAPDSLAYILRSTVTEQTTYRSA